MFVQPRFSKTRLTLVSRILIVVVLCAGVLASFDVSPQRAWAVVQFEWKTPGFAYPSGIVADKAGNVYVADTFADRIQKVHGSTGAVLAVWGSKGSADGQFNHPGDVAIDGSGNVYVADTGNQRIQKFDPTGKFLTKWGSSGSGNGQFLGPVGIAIDASGNFYVADAVNYRIEKFDPNGNFVTKWGSRGSGDTQFGNPADVAVDSWGRLYVADNVNDRIQRFDTSGNFVMKWGTKGTGDGQFDDPVAVATDPQGRVYVADHYNHRIQRFSPDGAFISKWGSHGKADGQFDQPRGIDVSSSGFVYVADAVNLRVQAFKLSGPGKATLLGPSGGGLSNPITYRWNPVPESTWYYLRVDAVGAGTVHTDWYKASDAGCATGTAVCAVTPGAHLSNGDYQWSVQTWDLDGYGLRSDLGSFAVGPPGKATLISPSGSGVSNPVEYTWSAVPGATHYYLWVNGPSRGSVVTKRWYKAAEAGCAGGTGTCRVNSPVTLGAGDRQWWIQTWNPSGYGPWSSGSSFGVVVVPPSAATLREPAGGAIYNSVTFKWDAVAAATHYYLWVNGPGGTNIIKSWYTEAQAGCGGGVGLCQLRSPVALSLGDHRWWVQAWNAAGYGPWSAGTSFTLGPPGKAELISPSNETVGGLVTYVWDSAPGATRYYLWVNDESGAVMKQWYRAVDAGCQEPGMSCEVTVPVRLRHGAYKWWIQTWNPSGYGPWSDGHEFSVRFF